MKFRFGTKNKMISFNIKLENGAEENNNLEIREKYPKKTRYQIKEEEKRKMKELEHEHHMQNLMIGLLVFGALIGIAVFSSIIEAIKACF